MLPVGEGHRVAWTSSGNPAGEAVLILHGGPGSGSSASARRRFDPVRHRIIQFDQRGCGLSLPHAADAATDLASITTNHLIGDIEALRRHLGIERWLVVGGSWGATLAQAYTQRHTQRVRGVLLAPVTMTTRAEIDWITRGVRVLLPDAWERFRDGVRPADRDGDLAAAYARLLNHHDACIRQQAADDWCAWEQALVAVAPGHVPHSRWLDAGFRYGFARLVTHVWRHRGWLAERALLRGAARLGDIPAILVHGRMDIGSPLDAAWQLHRAWPGSELTVVETAGHDVRDHGMAEAITQAAARLATLAGEV